MRRTWIAISILLAGIAASFLLWPERPAPQRGAGEIPREAPTRAAGDRAPAAKDTDPHAESTARGPRTTTFGDAQPPTSASAQQPTQRPEQRPSDDEPWIDAEGEPSVAFVRSLIREGVETHLPRHKLSSDEIERLAEATLALRNAQHELRALPYEVEHAERRRALLEQLQEASLTFEELLDMSPGEFTQALEPAAGVDALAAEGEPIPEPEFLPPRRAP